jgi:Rieske Fe-S protein
MTTENTPATKPVATPASKTIKPVVKTVAKPAAKPAAKSKAEALVVTAPKAKPVAKTVAKPVAKKAVVKDVKAKKPKMVRDSFTFPKDEYTVMDALKLRAAKLGHPVKKTELLRAGVKAIAAMSDTALLSALKAVPSLKTGRPAKN